MAGVLIDAGGEMAKATLPEKHDAFDKQVPDQMFNGLNNFGVQTIKIDEYLDVEFNKEIREALGMK